MKTSITTKEKSLNTKGKNYPLLFCILFLSWPIAANGARVLTFGDSITAGYGSNSGGYPPMLESLLNDHGKPTVVINKGISGEVTPAGVERFDSVLASVPTDVVLIMEGTNDIRHGFSVETTRQNLQKMVNAAKARGITPILATLPPSDKSGSEILIPLVWNPMIASLAISNGVQLVDEYTAILPAWSTSNTDGIHPNDTGYNTVARTWYSAISPMISSTGSICPVAGGSGGFIAVAVFDTSMEKHVKLLGELRDAYLLTNYPGQQFVKAYYRYSLPVADFISRHEGAKLAVQVLLYPIIGLSFVLLKFSLTLQLTMATLIAATFILFGLFL